MAATAASHHSTSDGSTLMQNPMQDPMQAPMQPPMEEHGEDRNLAEAMEKAVNMGREIIYEPEIFESVIQSVAQEPVDALAQAVVMVMDKIIEHSGRMPPNVALGVGMALIADVADALGETGHHEYSPPEITAAVSAATSMFLSNHEGDYSADELNQYAEELAQGIPAEQAPAGPPPEPGYLGGM